MSMERSEVEDNGQTKGWCASSTSEHLRDVTVVRRTQAQVFYIPHSSTAHGHALSLLLLCAHIDGLSSAGVRRPIVGRCRASTPHEFLMTSAVCCDTFGPGVCPRERNPIRLPSFEREVSVRHLGEPLFNTDSGEDRSTGTLQTLHLQGGGVLAQDSDVLTATHRRLACCCGVRFYLYVYKSTQSTRLIDFGRVWGGIPPFVWSSLQEGLASRTRAALSDAWQFKSSWEMPRRGHANCFVCGRRVNTTGGSRAVTVR